VERVNESLAIPSPKAIVSLQAMLSLNQAKYATIITTSPIELEKKLVATNQSGLIFSVNPFHVKTLGFEVTP
jgi:hypothetical protein